MSQDRIPFPESPACSPSSTHRLWRGGMNMEVKHTHPQYEDPQARQQQMEDAYAACMAKLRALRAAQREKTA